MINSIEKLCKQYNIKNYQINDDLTVDVDGNVDLSNQNISTLPLKFGIVSGGFSCAHNYLTTLKGCPSSVGEWFLCHSNKLQNLKYCPSYIGNDFDCSLNELTSLKYSPNVVYGDFSCSDNHLKSLEYCPKVVTGDFCCSCNCNTIENIPYNISVGCSLYFYNVSKTRLNINSLSVGKYFNGTSYWKF